MPLRARPCPISTQSRRDSLPRQATPGRYGNASSGGNGGWAGRRSINIKITKGGSEAPESESEAGLTPLGFLLGVMRAADTPPHLRLQVASLVARYLHPKRGGDDPPKIVVEDPTSFSIDPELAMEFRDAKFRYDILYKRSISHPEDYEREAPDLKIRIAELESSLQCPCPSMYSKKQYDRDQERLKELARVRHSGLKLSRQEDVEEAWLTARVASWWTTPQAAAYERMFSLSLRDWKRLYSTAEPLSLREKAEFRVLQMLYPRGTYRQIRRGRAQRTCAPRSNHAASTRLRTTRVRTNQPIGSEGRRNPPPRARSPPEPDSDLGCRRY